MSRKRSPDIQALFGAANLPAIDAGIDSMIDHPATSDWLRQALKEARRRDALDALRDAETLVELLRLRLNALLLTHGRIRFDPDV